MKLTNEIITLETNENAEIVSVNFKGIEMLQEGKDSWTKIYLDKKPLEAAFVKANFWKNLVWEQIYEGHSLTLLATHYGSEDFKNILDIQINISLNESSVVVTTTLQNLSSEELKNSLITIAGGEEKNKTVSVEFKN